MAPTLPYFCGAARPSGLALLSGPSLRPAALYNAAKSMSSLIVYLPLEPAGPTTLYGYVLAADRRAPASAVSAAPVALLPQPAHDGEVVAVVPSRRCRGTASPCRQGSLGSAARLRAVLDGLLEDRLLDEPEALHFALEPRRAPAPRSGSPRATRPGCAAPCRRWKRHSARCRASCPSSPPTCRRRRSRRCMPWARPRKPVW